MPVATIIGEGTGDETLTLTFATSPPDTGVLQAVFAVARLQTLGAFIETVDVTDPWIFVSSEDPIIGFGNRGDTFPPDPEPEDYLPDHVWVASAAKTCNPSSDSFGDEVVINFTTPDEGTCVSAGVIVYLPAELIAVSQSNITFDSSTVYSNGLGWYNIGQSDTLLSWPYSAVDAPIGDDENIAIAAYGSYPGTTATSLELDDLGGTAGGVSIDVAVKHFGSGIGFDPGANFGGGTITAANYQLLVPSVPGEDVVVPPPDPSTFQVNMVIP